MANASSRTLLREPSQVPRHLLRLSANGRAEKRERRAESVSVEKEKATRWRGGKDREYLPTQQPSPLPGFLFRDFPAQRRLSVHQAAMADPATDSGQGVPDGMGG